MTGMKTVVLSTPHPDSISEPLLKSVFSGGKAIGLTAFVYSNGISVFNIAMSYGPMPLQRNFVP